MKWANHIQDKHKMMQAKLDIDNRNWQMQKSYTVNYCRDSWDTSQSTNRLDDESCPDESLVLDQFSEFSHPLR